MLRFKKSASSRKICTFHSTNRQNIGQARVVGRTQTLADQCPQDPTFGQVEMDTHADTCVLGKNFIVLHHTGRECDVSPSYDEIKGVQIITGATSWTCQGTGELLVLVIHESLWMPASLTHSLVNPNQLRAFVWFNNTRQSIRGSLEFTRS
jgi:hypothetical protein